MELTSRSPLFHGELRALAGPMLATECALMLALVALVGMPEALFLLAAVALFAGRCALGAALRPAAGGALLRAGRVQLGLLLALAVVCFLRASGDWVHALWSVQFPMLGLFLGAGLLLVGAGSADREQEPARGWNFAALALAGLALLCALPLLLAALSFETRPASRDGAATLAALVDVVRYGFGGEVPASMRPHGEAAHQLARGLGVPARNVTVTMGASFLAAALWSAFAALALVGRAIRSAALRRRFLLLAPAVLALAAFPVLPEPALWRNEPWLVQAYGPTLLVAAVATLALFAALRVDARRALNGR